MASDAVRVRIEQLLLAAFAAKRPGTPIGFENTKFDQPKGTPWVYVAYQPNQSRRMNIGTRRVFRHMGIVIISCMAPEDSGTKTINEIRDIAFNAVVDRSENLGADGYLKLCFAETRNRGMVNGWLAYSVQVEYHQDVDLQE